MMFRGLLRCSFPCRHAASALVAATAAGVSAARMANYNHTNTEANTLHDSLNDERLVNNSNNAENTPHMTRTRGPASHFTAYYSGAVPLPRRRPSVFAPMRRPQAYTRHTPANSNTNTTTTTTTNMNVQDMPRRRVVMSKAQQIRQAARHMREAQRAQRVNSPAAYLILSATQEQLNREADLVSATLQRLQAEKALVQARQESAEDMQQFALGIEQRRRAVHNKDQCNEAQLNYYTTPHETDNNANTENTTNDENMREGVYQAVISEPSLKQQHNTNNTTIQPSRAMTASAMEQEVQKTLAETVDAKLLGLPATADHEAALAMQRRTSHSRKSPQTEKKKKNNSITRDGNRKKKTTSNTKKAVVAVQPARRRGRPSKQQQQQQTKKNNKNTNTPAKQRKPSQAPRRVGRPAKATSVRPHAKSRSRHTSAAAGKKKKSASQKRTR